jgi:alpha-tubulin suppressor-like RCC1 family protein
VAYTFGRNDKGQCGDGSTTARSEPFKIELDEKVVDASVGRSHSLIVTESGIVYGTGENKSYQALGDESKPSTLTEFTKVKDLPENIAQVSCGAEFSFAITKDGEVYGWGNPQYGQIGTGSDHQYIASTNRALFAPQSPKKVAFPNDAKIVQLVCGTNHGHALDDQGNLYSWGFAGFGRLGLNHSPPKDIMTPTMVSGFGDRNNPVKKIAAGPTCGMLIDSISI